MSNQFLTRYVMPIGLLLLGVFTFLYDDVIHLITLSYTFLFQDVSLKYNEPQGTALQFSQVAMAVISLIYLYRGSLLVKQLCTPQRIIKQPESIFQFQLVAPMLALAVAHFVLQEIHTLEQLRATTPKLDLIAWINQSYVKLNTVAVFIVVQAFLLGRALCTELNVKESIAHHIIQHSLLLISMSILRGPQIVSMVLFAYVVVVALCYQFAKNTTPFHSVRDKASRLEPISVSELSMFIGYVLGVFLMLCLVLEYRITASFTAKSTANSDVLLLIANNPHTANLLINKAWHDPNFVAETTIISLPTLPISILAAFMGIAAAYVIGWVQNDGL